MGHSTTLISDPELHFHTAAQGSNTHGFESDSYLGLGEDNGNDKLASSDASYKYPRLMYPVYNAITLHFSCQLDTPEGRTVRNWFHGTGL